MIEFLKKLFEHREFLPQGSAYLWQGEVLWLSVLGNALLGLSLLIKGEVARGSGWLGRARRLIDEAGLDCAERGYLLVPAGETIESAMELLAEAADAASLAPAAS